MKLTKSQLKEIIRQELKEAPYVREEDAVRLIFQEIEDLQGALRKVKNKKLEKWAEKYPRSVSGIVEMTQRIIKFLDKLK